MRLGILSRVDPAELDFVQRLGLRCFQWVRFADGPCGPGASDWKDAARRLQSDFQTRDLRCSAIAAGYANPLDPAQRDHSRALFLRAIEVAALLGVRTVSGFPGAIIEPAVNERGGNPVYQSLEAHLPRIMAFWDDIASFAADNKVRLAFEHCPQGPFHLPVMGFNFLGQPALWEPFFLASRHQNIGLEWDPAHLICQMIDPLQNLRQFGDRIFHVHAKDAFIDRPLLEKYGICHPGVAEHRFPGLGQSNWSQLVHALARAGYDSDLNIEGWHDPVYRNHAGGLQLEETGIRIARATLEPLLIPDPQ